VAVLASFLKKEKKAKQLQSSPATANLDVRMMKVNMNRNHLAVTPKYSCTCLFIAISKQQQLPLLLIIELLGTKASRPAQAPALPSTRYMPHGNPLPT
jgi:hypothetical protein